MKPTGKISSALYFVVVVSVMFPMACKMTSDQEAASVSLSASNAGSEWNSLPADYENQSGCAKEDMLWNTRVLATRYSDTNLPKLEGTGGLDIILGALGNKLKTKMDYIGDQAPLGWKKPLHRRAVLAKVKFVAEANTPFTGLFRGAPCGFLRLSLTADPGKKEYNPGLAWKAFVDGKPSANISALVSLDGQGENFNFFANEFSNIVPPSESLKLKIAARAFRTTSNHPHKIGAQGFAQLNSDGGSVAQPHAPVRLFFVPDVAVNGRFSSTPPRDFRDELLRGLEVGQPLFNVYAVNYPNPEHITADEIDKTVADQSIRNKAVKLGTLINTSSFIASRWGDDGIFFNHQRFRNE